jgi:hypothetical protein
MGKSNPMKGGATYQVLGWVVRVYAGKWTVVSPDRAAQLSDSRS